MVGLRVGGLRVRRAGHLLLHDAIRLDGEVGQTLQRTPIAGGARSVATLVYVASNAEAQLDAVRAVVADENFGASAWNGMLIARILADTGAALRASVIAALRVLRGERPLPRVWMC